MAGKFVTIDDRVVFIGGPGQGAGGSIAAQAVDKNIMNEFLESESLNPELSEEEYNLMVGYKGDDYFDINDDLRVGGYTVSGVEHEIDAIIQRGIIPEDTIVFRGTDYDVFDEENLTGQIFRDDAYVSTTLSHKVAENFSDGDVISIFVPKGTNAINMQRFSQSNQTKNEAEVLLPRESKFRVLFDSGYDDNPRLIEMEFVQ